MKIREKILRKLFPEVYKQTDKAATIVAHYEALKASLKNTGGIVQIEGPVGVLGDLVNCKVELKPQINTELVLSKYQLDSMLHIAGDHGLVSQNLFTNREFKDAIKGLKVEKVLEVDLDK